MPSLPSASTGGRAAPLCSAGLLLPLCLLLLCLGCSGASLREHRLRGSESDPQWGDAHHQTPSADMAEALDFLQGLRQRSHTDAQQAGDGERLRGAMRLASAPKEEEEEEDAREDKSEELLQAVLSTLQQTEKASKAPQQQKQQAITPHKKLPLMFEDEDEEGEGDEDEEDEEGTRDSPFKRTNENVEEKYTPQNLATLQSVFDELDKLTGGKTVAHKRRDEDEDEDATAEEEEDDDGEDLFSLRSNDDVDLEDWVPLRDQEEQQEEEEADAKREFDRGLDYAYDEDEDEDEDGEEEEEEEDGESYLVRRSSEPDDVTNLVDYYLLKVLERTEEEEQKRAVKEKDEDNVDPRAVYQLLQLSQRYQIPPEDLLDMMRSGGEEPASRAGSRFTPTSTKKTHSSFPDSAFYSRRVPERQTDPRTQEVLNILGLGDTQLTGQAPPRKQYKSTWLRPPSPAPRRPLRPPAAKPYEDTVDEDELAAYLAAQMLAQQPDRSRSRSRAGPKREEEAGPGSFQRAVQDFLMEQMDSDRELKGQTGDEGRGGDTASQAVMKLLSYLKPEESDTKSAAGI